jgi:hypothetical protein
MEIDSDRQEDKHGDEPTSRKCLEWLRMCVHKVGKNQKTICEKRFLVCIAGSRVVYVALRAGM